MKIVETTKQIQTKVNNILSRQVIALLRKKRNRIYAKIEPIITQALINSPEIQSLSGGTLRYDFGLTQDPTGEIVNAIVNSLMVDVNPVKSARGGFVAGITVSIQPSNFANLLHIEQPISDGSLPWMEWLLTAGDNIIIANFGVEYAAGTGRSGGATMSSESRPFKVDARYSGTIENNFITRALDANASKLINVIEKEIS